MVGWDGRTNGRTDERTNGRTGRRPRPTDEWMDDEWSRWRARTSRRLLLAAGEDLADRNIVSPVVGVWSPNVILLIISLYLILHTVKEQAPLRSSFSFLKRLFKKSGRQKNNQ